MRRNRRKRTEVGKYQGVTYFINSGESGHKSGPHVHAVVGSTDWRLLLRTDDYEVKNGSFSQTDKKKMWRGYSEQKGHFMARWDATYPDDPVEAVKQKPAKNRKR